MTRSIWLSFADEEKGFIGVCIVDVEVQGRNFVEPAITKAWKEGCNPGGEVLGSDVTNHSPEYNKAPRNKIMNKEELKKYNLI